MTPNVSLIDMPATPIAYFRHTGPYGRPLRASGWSAWRRGWPRTISSAACATASRTTTRRSPIPAKCRYDAGVAADPKEVLSGQPLRTVLPGGRYACTRFEGTVDDIDAAWQRLLGGWLPSSGLQLDARPMLEHYPVDIDVRSADRRVRLQPLHSGGAAVTDGSRRRLHGRALQE